MGGGCALTEGAIAALTDPPVDRYRLFGNPSSTSATRLRRISALPP
jgi:hypothetical protein